MLGWKLKPPLLSPESQNNPLMSMMSPFADGPILESSIPSVRQLECDSTTLMITSKKEKQVRNPKVKTNSLTSVTVESVPADKKTTSNDKLLTCKSDSLRTESSKILDLESTSNEKVYKPFWNSLCQENSNKLWCPTETDSVASRLNCLNGSFHPITSNSWFSIQKWILPNILNSLKTSLPSLMFSIAESMEKENIPKSQINPNKAKKLNPAKQKLPSNIPNSCRKVRLHPSPTDYKRIIKWFGSCRYTYNWILSEIKKSEDVKAIQTDAFQLRTRFINADNIPDSKKFLLETPKEVRYGALEDLVNGMKLNFRKGGTFDMKFRSKKDTQSILLPKDSVKQFVTKEEALKNKTKAKKTKKEERLSEEGISFYPTFFDKIIKMSVSRCNEINYDSRLVLDKLGRIYLMIPQSVKVHENQMDCKMNWCSLDPGVRTFMTLYSPEQTTAIKYGVGDAKRIFRLCLHLDKLIAKRSKSKKKRNLKKAENRLRYKIKHLVDDVHWKIISHLTKHFHNIIIPPFEIKSMVNKATRKLTNKSVRQLYNWRHYTFRQRLLNHSKITGTTVYVKEESFTTKTCTVCGKINDVKGNKIINCMECKETVDRDMNGARNIFLKHVGKGCSNEVQSVF